MEDFVAWRFNKKGFFTARSAYHMEWESQFGNNLRRIDGSGNANQNPVWEELWKSKIPAKIKIFG
jgi:hypothetical protein